MKTVEEMRVAVLAECETVCPNRDFPAKADWGHLMFGYVTYDGDDYEAWFLYVSASIHPISLYARSADQIWIAAYRLLGLSERDAVAETKSFYESLFADLKKSDLQLVEIYAQAEVGRLQSEKRNAALVAALEKAKNYIKASLPNTIITGCKEENYYFAYHQLIEALAANEKGGNG